MQQAHNLMSTMWSFAHGHRIELTAKHLARSKNVHADRLSRKISPYVWKLNPNLFRYIDQLWGPHTIDRFASDMETQLNRYNSYLWDPHTEGVDALAQQNWKQENETNVVCRMSVPFKCNFGPISGL